MQDSKGFGKGGNLAFEKMVSDQKGWVFLCKKKKRLVAVFLRG